MNYDKKTREGEKRTSTIQEALLAMINGTPLVVVDNEDRENEGDLIVAAEKATAETVAFMVRWTSGVLCVSLPSERTLELQLPLMVEENSDSMCTAFTVSVDLRAGTTTGISASERAATIRALVDPSLQAYDFTRPGHVFPLRAVHEGVLKRPGHTEAAVDLARLAGLRPGGVLAEIVNDDGTMARRLQLERFARLHGLPLITIHDLICYRQKMETAGTRPDTTHQPDCIAA
ncbi:UNVERIFIED_ORG: 3,4-dihydroxy 2-butanone 4-phosphate synthase/GTP cyclohydrolase II [Paraburkholderia sediminicola]|nr:3,4-dihydroxy 2-butanone 4-phosphate synthase/GTP cyclohydrolase II [Paraburkholderia sediminicola]